MSNRELLLDAAEAIVREQGIEGVTLRAVAARAHFGKSTVHETFGSTTGLVQALQARAAKEMFDFLNVPPSEEEENQGELLALRTAQWAMANPEWARLAVRPHSRGEDPPLEVHPLGAAFFDEERAWLVDVDPELAQTLERCASLVMLSAIELVSALDNAERGATIIVDSYAAVVQMLETVLGGAREDAAQMSAQNSTT